jgi:hypothetical protein
MAKKLYDPGSSSGKLRGADAVFVALAEAIDQTPITLDREFLERHLGSSKPKHPMFGCFASQAGNRRRSKAAPNLVHST